MLNHLNSSFEDAFVLVGLPDFNFLRLNLLLLCWRHRHRAGDTLCIDFNVLRPSLLVFLPYLGTFIGVLGRCLGVEETVVMVINWYF